MFTVLMPISPDPQYEHQMCLMICFEDSEIGATVKERYESTHDPVSVLGDFDLSDEFNQLADGDKIVDVFIVTGCCEEHMMAWIDRGSSEPRGGDIMRANPSHN